LPKENPSEYLQLLQWLQATGAILAAITALVIATFQDKMRAWFKKAELDVSIDLRPPDCLKIPMNVFDQSGQTIDTIDTYYLRLKVINNGNQKAESVEVFASNLLEEQGDDQWREVTSFLPMNLVWADNHLVFYPMLYPEMHRHCDLAHIMNPQNRIRLPQENKTWLGVPQNKTILSFDTHAHPSTLSYLHPPGKYRLVLAVGAANAKTIKKTLEITLDGSWYNDEDEMFGKGVSVLILS
jgi:hypothetical protein